MNRNSRLNELELAGFGRIQPIDDITDEERAIIQSMIDEEERLKAAGIPPSALIENSVTRVIEVTPRSTFHPDFSNSTPSPPSPLSPSESYRHRVIDITDPNDARPIELRLQALKEERESDQKRLNQLAAMITPLVQNTSSLSYLNHPNNVEETEKSLETPFSQGLFRQPSYFKETDKLTDINNSNHQSSINPLLLLAAEPSPRSKSTVHSSKDQIDITRLICVGFTSDIQYGQTKIKNPTPFCFQWIDRTLRINGVLSFSPESANEILKEHQNRDTFMIKFLSSDALSLSLDQEFKEFYRIDEMFLQRPFTVTRSTGHKTGHHIGIIDYDRIGKNYFLVFYLSLYYFRLSIPMNYGQVLDLDDESSIISIDLMVQLSFESHNLL